MAEQRTRRHPTYHAWQYVIVFAVLVMFTMLLAELVVPGLPEQWPATISILNDIITVVFLLDLVILYKEEKSLHHFLRYCWPDILATIPFLIVTLGILKTSVLAGPLVSNILSLFKAVRFVRFIKVARTGNIAFWRVKKAEEESLKFDA